MTKTIVENLFDVKECVIIKASGTTLVGFTKAKDKRTTLIVGVPCNDVPNSADFLNLFKKVSSNDAVELEVATEHVAVMNMQMEQRAAFASMAAKYQFVLDNKDEILTGMAVDNFMGK